MTRYIRYTDVENSRIEVGSVTAVNLEDALRVDGNWAKMRQTDIMEVYSDTDLQVFWNGNVPTAELGFPIAAKNLTTITGANPKDINFLCAVDGETAIVIVQVGNAALGFTS